MSQATISNSMSLKSSKILVFIDANVDDFEYLAQGVKPGIEVHLLDADEDGIEQITADLLTRPHLEAIHIVSHGSPGRLYLGNSQLSLDTLKRYTNLLQTWSASEILLYGCNVAAGDAGTEFIEKLHQLTGANIAASRSRTGNVGLGGNWELDFITGQIKPELAFDAQTQMTYIGVLGNGKVWISGTPEEDSTLTAKVSDPDGISS